MDSESHAPEIQAATTNPHQTKLLKKDLVVPRRVKKQGFIIQQPAQKVTVLEAGTFPTASSTTRATNQPSSQMGGESRNGIEKPER